MDFSGFQTADFDAYAPIKWSSNVFNVERLHVKQKLETLGRQLAPTMVAGDGALLDVELSAEHPTVWNQRRVDKQYVFFYRNQEARAELDHIISRSRSLASLVQDPSPLRNHLVLALTVDSAAVEIALKLHADAVVDRDNLLRKAHDFFQRDKLLSRIACLPRGFAVGVGEDSTQWIEASKFDDTSLSRLIQEFATAKHWWVVARRVERDAAIALGADLIAEVKHAFGALLPLYCEIAWRRDNDHLSMREKLREQDAKQRSKGLSREDRVRVVRGAFSGKTGSVEAVDPKGAVRVRLGTLVLKLAGDDLVKL